MPTAARPLIKKNKQKRSGLSLSIKIGTVSLTILFIILGFVAAVKNSYVVIFSNFEKDCWLFVVALEILAIGEVAAAIANGSKKEVAKNLYDTGQVISAISLAAAFSAFALSVCTFVIGRQSILWVLIALTLVQAFTIIVRRKKGVTTSSVFALIMLVIAETYIIFFPAIFGGRALEAVYLLAIPISLIVIPIAAKVFDKTRKERLGASACVTAASICVAIAAASAVCFYALYFNIGCHMAEKPIFSSAPGGFTTSYEIDRYTSAMDRYRLCRDYH